MVPLDSLIKKILYLLQVNSFNSILNAGLIFLTSFKTRLPSKTETHSRKEQKKNIHMSEKCRTILQSQDIFFIVRDISLFFLVKQKIFLLLLSLCTHTDLIFQAQRIILRVRNSWYTKHYIEMEMSVCYLHFKNKK